MPKHSEYIERIIPYRLGMVDIFYQALTEMTFTDGAKSLEIFVDGKLKIRGNTNAYSNMAIEAGIIHARALLEFLGLKLDRNDTKKLKERDKSSKYKNDLFIEHFKNKKGD